MSSTRQNGIITITNDENYDLAGHMARMADSTNVPTIVANQAARDALTAYLGMIVCRLDLGWVLEIWNGTIWISNGMTNYTAALQGSTTNPSLGSGTITATASVSGKILTGQFAAAFGTGATSGSGSFNVTLPTAYTYAVVDSRLPVGLFTAAVGTSLISGYLRQGGASNNYVNFYWQPTATTQSAVSSSTFAWASGSYINGSFSVILA